MAEIKTGADSLRFYHTGAASDGAAQTDPTLSYGAFRAASVATHLGCAVTNPIANITIDFVAGKCGPGAASLEATGINAVAFTSVGGSQGAAVTILNGETKMIIDGTDTDCFIIVTRTSATNLTGTATLTLSEQYNNLLGSNNISSALATAGTDKYYCLCVKNDSAAQALSILFWINCQAEAILQTSVSASGPIILSGTSASSFDSFPACGGVKNPRRGWVHYYDKTDGQHLAVINADMNIWADASQTSGVAGDELEYVGMIRIGKEAPGSQPTGTFTDVSGDPTSAPGGVSFYTPTSGAHADVINIGDLLAGYIYGIWVHEKVMPGATAISSVLKLLDGSADTI